ncbi:HEAT repeat domain-containing protein [Paenibacillus lautus]|uniref:HEAT repeat domain-containing protein n=1 Tax=Paenibacillus lautus TaxID=1401 RepID=UPI003D2C1F61
MNRLDSQELIMDMPENYEELKSSANRNANWRERLDAVEALGNWKNQKSIDILLHRLNTDAVYQVREAAYRKLLAFGEDVQMPERPKGELMKDVSKVLLRIKKSLPRDHTYEDFKEKLKKMRIDIYDTYEGDKGDDFDHWLEQTWSSLLRR